MSIMFPPHRRRELEKNVENYSVKLPFLVARKMQDPFNKGVHLHEFLVDTRHLPDMPVDANARPSDAAKDRRVYKSVRHAALDGGTDMDESVTPGLFGYKHLGINVIATAVEELDKETAILHFKDGEGVMNGGHGMAILRELQAKYGPGKMPPNFIKVSVIVGLDDGVIPEVAGANNTSVQVKLSSLLELQGAFEPLKASLKGSRMEHSVQWREGDKAPIKVEDLIAVMTCFRSDVYPTTYHRRTPHNAYAYKAGVVGDFRADPEGYHALAPRLQEILEFQDYVRTQPKKEYNEKGGRFGALKFVDSIFVDAKGNVRDKPLPQFVMPFTGETVSHRINIAAVYPILAAFRGLIERVDYSAKDEKMVGGTFKWTIPFAEVKELWDEISLEVMDTTKERCFNLEYKLSSLGKDRPHWREMQRIVENAMLRRALKVSRAETAVLTELGH